MADGHRPPVPDLADESLAREEDNGHSDFSDSSPYRKESKANMNDNVEDAKEFPSPSKWSRQR